MMAKEEEEKEGYWEWLLPFNPYLDILPENLWATSYRRIKNDSVVRGGWHCL